jgi:hypothetical protein
MKNKYAPRQTKRGANLRSVNRKPYDKKTRRLSVQVHMNRNSSRNLISFFFSINTILQSKYKPVSREQTSDSEVPTKRRRNRSHTGNLAYRSFRRKAKTPLSSAASNTSTRVADKSDSSSDYDENITPTINNNNNNNNNSNANDTRDTNLSIPIPSTRYTYIFFI